MRAARHLVHHPDRPGRVQPRVARHRHPPARCSRRRRRLDQGALLDLGCGAGAIALTLARRAPAAQVWAVDVNERARALCARQRCRQRHRQHHGLRARGRAGRPPVRHDLVEPADPDRQGRAPRPPAGLAPPAGPRRARPRSSSRSTSAPTPSPPGSSATSACPSPACVLAPATACSTSTAPHLPITSSGSASSRSPPPTSTGRSDASGVDLDPQPRAGRAGYGGQAVGELLGVAGAHQVPLIGRTHHA